MPSTEYDSPDALETPADPELAEDEYRIDEEEAAKVPAGGPRYADDSENLALELEKYEEGKKALEELGEEVVRDYDADVTSCEVRTERIAKDWGLFSGELPDRNGPFPGCANAHIPVMMENVLRIVTRVDSEMFGDYTHFLTVLPHGNLSSVEADAMTLYDNEQFRKGIPDFQRQMARGLLNFFVPGDVIADTFYDKIRGCNRVEVLGTDDVALPYVHVSTMPDFSDLPRITKVLRLYRHELERMKGLWRGVRKVLDRDADAAPIDEQDAFAAANAPRQGHEPSEKDKHGAYRLLRQDRWCRLPEQDRDRWIRVIVDRETKVVMSLVIHEEVNAEDQDRYDREMMEMEQYTSMLEQHGLAMQQHQELLANAEFVMGRQAVPVEQQGEVLGQVEQGAPQPPPRPSWMTEDGQAPVMPEKKPIYLYAHGVNIENMSGVYGLGHGRILADHNRVANTVTNQAIDSATLANSWGVILRKEVTFEGGKLVIGPGKINIADGLSDDIRRDLLEMKPAPANSQLFEVSDRIQAAASRVAQSPDVLGGASGKSGESFRGLNARIEQATKQISVPARKFGLVFDQIAQNIAKLNGIYLKEGDTYQLLNYRTGKVEPVQVRREWYAQSYRFSWRCDFRFASADQIKKEADEALQLPKTVPMLAGNVYYRWVAARQSLEARGFKTGELIEALGPMPPKPTTPLGIPAAPPPPLGGNVRARGAPGAPRQPGPPAPPGPPRPPVAPGNGAPRA